MAWHQTYPTFVGRLRLCFHRSGLNEMAMEEAKVVRATAISFGMIAWVMLGLRSNGARSYLRTPGQITAPNFCPNRE
jgi:hypothetical protein